MIHVLLRGGYRPDASFKTKLVVAIVKHRKLLDIVTTSSNVHDTAVLDPPLLSSHVPTKSKQPLRGVPWKQLFQNFKTSD